MNRSENVPSAFPTIREDSLLVASVIIPVYNGSATIEQCLNALAKQSLSPDCYEIIVVDDGSVDTTDTVVLAWRQQHPKINCKLIRQTNQGPAAARNRGAEIAQGELLLFTDADCRPAAEWIEVFLLAFGLLPQQSAHTTEHNSVIRESVRALEEDHDIDGLDGITAAMGTYRSEQESAAARFAQLEFEERYAHMRLQPVLDVVATYSAAFVRSTFVAVKGFDPAFPKANNEDVELSYRLSELGYRMIFVPDAIVYHPHNATWWDYAKTKMGRAYWRTIVYKRYPSKALKDSYTPQILKVQILLAPFCLLGLVWFTATRELRSFLLLVPFLLTTLPMLQFAFQKRNYRTIMWVPWGIWLRSIVFALGVATGIFWNNRAEQKTESLLQK